MKKVRRLQTSIENRHIGTKLSDFRLTINSLCDAIEELQKQKVNKPVETTNEQPKTKCKCAEGFQTLCANLIEVGPLEGCCQLDCINTFGKVI